MRGVILVLFILGGLLSHAQNDALTVTYSSTPFTDVVRDVESKTNYRFYFSDSWVDTLVVSGSFNNAHIHSILEKALQNTLIHYYIIDHKIILTKNIPILDKIDTTLFAEYKNTGSSKWNYSFQREMDTDEKDTQKENSIAEVGVRSKTRPDVVVLSGYIKERKTGESVPGAAVYVKNVNRSTTTDQYGFYSLSLPSGSQVISVSMIGMNDLVQRVMLHSDGKLNLMMDEKITMLKEVMIVSDQDQNVSNLQMGMSKIDMTTLKNVPKILGENDVFKVALSLPGVKSVGEGAAGLNVRGGNADQNLITLNEATIYNAVHFLGFFSVFNADAIKSFELYKSAIPAKFGGRLSSIFDVQMKDGNQKKISGQGGIGPITSHITLEVPLKKDKASLMLGGRSTYSNWVLKQIPDGNIKKSKASFYDFFSRFTYNVNDKNSIYLSLYYSHDKYNLSSDSAFSYHNALGSLQWRHLFNNDHSAVLSISQSDYKYNLSYTTLPENSFDLGFGINETHVKWNFNYTKNKHQFEYGIDSKLYQLNSGYINKPTEESLITERQINKEKGLENALYVADDIELTRDLSVSLGLRYSLFAALGPGAAYQYNPNAPKNEDSITDTVSYANNAVVKKYSGPEYRVSARYRLNDNTSIKASYNRTRQYIHMLSNTV